MVLGMHRSGTSALTRVLALLGADLPKNLMGAYPANPTGHWESNDLVTIHDQLLSSAGSRWDDWRIFNPEWFDSPAAWPFKQQILDVLRKDFAGSQLFVVKDPRICRFWPLWRDALAEFGAKPLIIMPVRNPLEVAASLKRRDGFNPSKSHLLWLRHVLDAEYATRAMPRAITSYQSLVEDWQDVIAGLTSQLRLSWPRRSATVDIEIEQFLSAEFKHHVVTPERLAGKPEVVDWVREAYATLTHMTGEGENPTGMAQLDRIRTSFDKASAAFSVALAMNEMEVAKRDADVQRLSTDLSTLREATAQREREEQAIAAGLSSELEAVRVAVNDRGPKLAEHERKIAELGEQLSAAKQKSEDLIREREALAAALAGQKTTAAQAAEQAALLGQETEALRGAVRDQEALGAKLRADLETMQSLASDRERERDALAVGHEGQKAAAAQAAEQAAALGRETEALRRVVRDHEAAAAKLRADLETMQSLASERERERDAAAVALEAQKVAAARAAEEAAALGRETEALRGAVRDHEAEAAQLNAQRREVQSALDRRQGEIDRLSGHLSSAQSSLRERDGEIGRLSRDLEATRLFLRHSQSEVQRLAGEADNAQAEMARADSDRRRVSDALAARSRELFLVRGRIERLQRRIRELLDARAQLTAAREEIVSLRTALAEARQEAISREALTAELARTTEQIRIVERNAAVLAHSERKAQAQIAALGDHLVDTEAALAKDRAERKRTAWKRIISSSPKRRFGRRLMNSGLFDAAWYLREYPDVVKNCSAPVEHYLEEGYLQGCRPNPFFDTRWYLQRYEDVRRAGINPLVHYLENGYREGRNPGPEFETDFYLLTYPDVRTSGMNPLVHYLRHGKDGGRLPRKP
jgi:hypothetical protein